MEKEKMYDFGVYGKYSLGTLLANSSLFKRSTIGIYIWETRTPAPEEEYGVVCHMLDDIRDELDTKRSELYSKTLWRNIPFTSVTYRQIRIARAVEEQIEEIDRLLSEVRGAENEIHQELFRRFYNGNED